MMYANLKVRITDTSTGVSERFSSHRVVIQGSTILVYVDGSDGEGHPVLQGIRSFSTYTHNMEVEADF